MSPLPQTEARDAGPLDLYRARLDDGALEPDPAQALAAEKLQALWIALSQARPRGLLARLSGRAPSPPRGLYLAGGVGRGKSMLMDLFFGCLPPGAGRRVHFHEFMRDIHAGLHRLRGQGHGTDDALPRLARDFASQCRLVCFDEFHVADVADAMILSRLFTALFEAGLVMVATSNWVPDDLYKGGLQRQRFLPFIELLKDRMELLVLEGGRDFRLDRLRGRQTWFTGPGASAALDALFDRLADGRRPWRWDFPLGSRAIPVARMVPAAGWFEYDTLCRRAHGAADFLALAGHFEAVFIDGVPLFTAERRDETRRFVTLVDALYERKVKLAVAAAAAPDALCPAGPLEFEFRRTASRLCEMQAADWMDRPHLPGA